MSQPLPFYPELHLDLCPVLALHPAHWLPSVPLESQALCWWSSLSCSFFSSRPAGTRSFSDHLSCCKATLFKQACYWSRSSSLQQQAFSETFVSLLDKPIQFYKWTFQKEAYGILS